MLQCNQASRWPSISGGHDGTLNRYAPPLGVEIQGAATRHKTDENKHLYTIMAGWAGRSRTHIRWVGIAKGVPAMATTTDVRKLIPIKEATLMLGMHDVRVTKELIRQGRLKARTIGRNVLVTARSLDEFVNGRD